MVGKVVGKRRKRPLPDANLRDSFSNQWTNSAGQTTLPSPAPTNVSESQNKRACHSSSWPSVAQPEIQQSLDFSSCGDQFLNFELCQQNELNAGSDGSYIIEASLPTPSMSPQQTQYLTPSELDAATPSTSVTSIFTVPTTNQTTLYHCSDPNMLYQEIEDDEVMLIKLLTQLKRLSMQSHHTFRSAISLVDKTNAAMERMLQSKTVRADYACHLLLTNILMHLVTFCELVSTLRGPQTGNELLFDKNIASGYNSEILQEQASLAESATTLQFAAKEAVRNTVAICVSVGNLLKRVPLHGFQVVGRNEGALIDLERRLRHTISTL